MSNFSEMLQYLRERDGLSQQELADKIKMSRSSVGMYESGSRIPRLEVLEAFADFFNVDMDFLVGHTESSEWSKRFRETLSKIMETYSHEDICAAGIDKEEIELIASGAIPLSFDRACSIADELGETLDTMLGRDSLDIAKSALGAESGLDIEIINLLLSVPEDKKTEAVNYLRYLAEHAER